MSKIIKKLKALELRKKGKSLDEISGKLNVPKSTVGVWCRNIKLGEKQIKRLADRQTSGSYKGRMIFLEKMRSERLLQTEKLRKEGLNEIKNISKRDLFVAGIGMYLSEGATSESSEEVSFTNSDFRTIIFIKKWFMEICGVITDRFVIQIRINKTHKNRVKNAERYWSEISGVPLSQFTKTILIITGCMKP